MKTARDIAHGFMQQLCSKLVLTHPKPQTHWFSSNDRNGGKTMHPLYTLKI
jgi:hypothetical protein